MSDEMDAWTRSWARVKTRGLDTSDLATALVQRAYRGASPILLQDIVDSAADDERLGDLVQGALRLCAAIGRRNRTPRGLMEISAALMDVEHGAASAVTRWAAQLIRAHEMCDDALNFESIDGLDPALFHSVGARSFNHTILESGDAAGLVFLEALALWRQLLPEVSALTVNAVGTELWKKN